MARAKCRPKRGRGLYHYWYHIGEIQAVRQMLGHAALPEYVGDLEAEAPYRPE